MKKRLLFLTLFFSLWGQSQRYSFLTYSLEQGLPQSQVTQITQDKNGFLWIGTLGGLSRFSGKEFDNYSVENGLLNNRISFLGFINDTLWVGHENGISIQSGKKFVPITTPNIGEDVKVVDVLEFKGKKIVATNGNGLLVYNHKQLEKIEPIFSNNYNGYADFMRVRDLVIKDNTLYIGTRMGLFTSHDLIHFSLVKGSEFLSISKLGVDQQGNLYFSTFGDGVQCWNGVNITKIKLGDTLISSRSKALFIDHNNHVWVAAKNNGVIRFEENKALLLNSAAGLPIDNISCVFEDRENNIWLGTEGKGLVRFSGEAFVYYSQETGLSSDLVMSVVQDNQKNYWISSYAKGITKWNTNNTIDYFYAGDSLANLTVWCSLKDKKGNLWFGTSAGIIVFSSLKKQIYTTENTPQLPGNKISALYQDEKGRIWIGGKDGISFFYQNQFYSFPTTTKIENVRSFAEWEQHIYFAAQLGLYIISPDQKVNHMAISKNRPVAFSVAHDYTGRIWIGTEEGLYYLKNNTLVNYFFSEENSSNFINFITPQQNNLWIGTNNGVFKLTNLEDLSHAKRQEYGIQDGLVSLETNLNSGYVDKANNFWFGTSSGLMRYNQKKETPIPNVLPSILFRGLKVNFEEVNLLSFAQKVNSNGIPISLELPYSKKHLVFQFTGITLTNPEQVFYSYKLDGFDEKWSPEMQSSEIIYSNLPSGKYVVCAKVRNKNNYTSTIIRIPFVINPPYYATWWFITICSILIVLIIFGLFSLRIKQIHRRQETERLVYSSKLRSLEQQSLNASMNRHFIFNALNSIQYFINTKDRLSANRYLSQFAKLIRKNLDSSTKDNNSVSLAEELERLDLYLSLESMRFPDKFSYVLDLDPEIDLENILVPSMIFQPFIENSIIHGILPQTHKKGLITFHARLISEDLIEFTIDDNGIGYQNSIQKKQPFGDHQSQGMLITSSRIELLRKISGKVFQLIGPEDILNNTNESIGTTVKIIISINMLDY
jgi:ligand-binding sensor domain-containing protein/two-component sensor histidine kinase